MIGLSTRRRGLGRRPGESPVTHHTQKQSDAQALGHSKGSRVSGCGHPSRLALTSPTLVAIFNRWSLRMPRAGISVQHTACTRRAARRRVLARAFCAQFPLRASLAPSAHALTSHGVLLTLQVESCTSPWLCTLLRSFRLSLSISAVRRRENAGRAGLSHAAPSRSTPRHRGRPACCCAHGEPFQK